MPVEITIPRLGWSMDQGVFAGWLHADGAHITAGDLLFELEGEKAVQEIESFDGGILCLPPDAPRDGDEVQVGQVVGFLLQPNEPRPQTVGPKPATPVTTEQPDPAASATMSTDASHSSTALSQQQTSSDHHTDFQPRVTPPPFVLPDVAAGPAARRLARLQRVTDPAHSTPLPASDMDRTAVGSAAAVSSMASPRARRRARELGVDWKQIRGSGRGGRVRERDVVQTPPQVQSSAPIPPPRVPGKFRKASPLRSVLAAKMLAGVNEAAPVTLHTKIEASHLLQTRARLKANPDTAHISLNALLLHEVALMLRENRDLNSCWEHDGIRTFDEINLSLAVDTPQGLLAPVIPKADELPLSDLATSSAQLIERTRRGRATTDDLQGGTFTVSNLGMLGIDQFTPILNLPQAAILGLGRITAEPVVVDGQVIAGHVMSLSLTFDHRVIDGAPAARWLQQLTLRLTRTDADIPTTSGGVHPADDV